MIDLEQPLSTTAGRLNRSPSSARARYVSLPPWTRLILPLALVSGVLLPLGALLTAVFEIDSARWAHMWETFLPRALSNTLFLIISVGAGTLIIGTAFAWLVTAYDFPGRRWFERLLLLPLAIPGFIMGFVYVSIFEYAGPVQTTLRGWFGWGRNDYTFPNIASPGGLVLVLTLVLYPYVYMLARSRFPRAGRRQLRGGAADGLEPLPRLHPAGSAAGVSPARCRHDPGDARSHDRLRHGQLFRLPDSQRAHRRAVERGIQSRLPRLSSPF
jgi:ABC-type spermidine/putrescine transport system permease subunit I